MKTAAFSAVITPELGCLVSGYDMVSRAVEIHDDLYATGLLVEDDRGEMALVISFDLQGLDAWYVKEVRKECAEILGIKEANVLLSCTHNHSGPQTITEWTYDHLLDRPYMANLKTILLKEVKQLPGRLEKSLAYTYSILADENLNRRYTSEENLASFLPHRAQFREISKGYADKELAMLIFTEEGSSHPTSVIANYAAHPLASHTPGKGYFRVSADFPGPLRDLVMEETGAQCIFVSGAAGDMVPKEDELGYEAACQMGKNLARKVIRGMVDAPRNPRRLRMENVLVGGKISHFKAPTRKKIEKIRKEKEVDWEIQTLAIGDFTFTGVPGEVCAELGQEVKWHSPFRRSCIAFCSTGYMDYIVPGNFLVSGGYEAKSHRFKGRYTIDFVKCAVDALYDLYEELHPAPEGEDILPDAQDLGLVNVLPGK